MARIYLSPPHMGPRERALLLEAFDSNWIAPLGPQVDGFERELARTLGVAHAAALSSGTAALHLALRLLGVGPGDRVITSTLTFVATANAIAYLGATPVFIDSTPGSWNIDPDLLAEELEDSARAGVLPRAAVIVDIYGQCADHDAIGQACARHGVPVVEDAAEALGATYKGRSAGTLGTMGVFSFNGNKIITTSGGGMLVSERADLIESARFLATQAREPAPHYQHEALGYNYRMSNLLAAVGRGQLAALAERVARRRQINAWYRRALADVPGIAFMPRAPYGEPTWWLTCITVDEQAFGASREHIRQCLERRDIESRPVWKPMHLQPLYAGCPMRGGRVAERLFDTGLCLPSGSSLDERDLERVVEGILSARAQRSAG